MKYTRRKTVAIYEVSSESIDTTIHSPDDLMLSGIKIVDEHTLRGPHEEILGVLRETLGYEPDNRDVLNRRSCKLVFHDWKSRKICQIEAHIVNGQIDYKPTLGKY